MKREVQLFITTTNFNLYGNNKPRGLVTQEKEKKQFFAKIKQNSSQVSLDLLRKAIKKHASPPFPRPLPQNVTFLLIKH